MAFPIAAGVATTSVPTASATWTVNLPSGITAGDLLVMFTRQATTVLQGSNSGWVAKVDNGGDASDDVTSIAFKIASGSEGATVSWNQGSSCKGATICYLVTSAYPYDPNFVLNSPDWSGAGTGTGANPDPGGVTHTGANAGTWDTLFLEMAAMDGSSQVFSAPSTGFGSLVTIDSGTTGLATDNVRMAAATMQLTASSFNPDAMTADAATTGWTGFTVAIRPRAALQVPATSEFPLRHFGPF